MIINMFQQFENDFHGPVNKYILYYLRTPPKENIIHN